MSAEEEAAAAEVPRPVVEQREYYLKILIVGDANSGKTSIIRRYIDNTFSNRYKITIGVDFLIKPLSWDEHTFLRLQFWDIAGQERFGHMTPMYYREAVGAFVVYDLTSASTWESVPKWKQDLDAHLNYDGNVLPCVLLANKSDIFDEQIDRDRMDRFCAENGFAAWFSTSAKEDRNIKEAVEYLVAAILAKNAAPQSPAKKGTVDVSAPRAGASDRKDGQSSPCQC